MYENLTRLQKALEQNLPEQLQAIKDQILDILSKAASNSLPPSWRIVIQEIGADNIVGAGLASRLRALLEDYRLSPKEASSLVGAIHTEMMTLHGNLNNYSNFARSLGLEPYTLGPGECEIGVIYPKTGVISDLESLVQESKDLDIALRAFMEIGGAAGSPRIKQVSSSEISIFFDVLAGVGAAVAKAIEKILGIIKTKGEIDKLRQEIEEKRIDLEAANLLKARAQAVEEKGLEEAAGAVIEIYVGSDEGRKNELRISVKNALGFMLIQTQRGILFESVCSL